MTDATPGFDPRRAFRLDGSVCVVTGGARGIGRAVAFGAARSGARVHLFDRDAEALSRTASEMIGDGLGAVAHRVDVTDEAAVIAALDAIMQAEGHVDALVNNAGMAVPGPAVELSVEDWQRVIDTNLTGTFLCARTAARHMLAAGAGAIVNIASIMGLSGGGPLANLSYQASKGGVVNLTRALAVEWAAKGVRVNAVAPTWVRTGFIRPLLAQPGLMDSIVAATPLGRIAEPDEIVGAVLFLLSPAAAMITGHTLPVDGGFLAA
jgi:NAD(P)-dependent dehydrogenase (short-subunit alcohol dehydrogenase family)